MTTLARELWTAQRRHEANPTSATADTVARKYQALADYWKQESRLLWVAEHKPMEKEVVKLWAIG